MVTYIRHQQDSSEKTALTIPLLMDKEENRQARFVFLLQRRKSRL